MKVTASGLWTAISATIVSAILGTVLFPAHFVCGAGARWMSSLSNMKQLSTSIAIYTTDYDDRLPIADKWGLTTFDYFKNATMYDDPLESTSAFGYGFFEPVSGLNLESVENVGEVPLLIQSEVLRRNAHSDMSGLPRVPRWERKDDLYAHLDTTARKKPRAWAANPVVIKRAKP